MPCVGETNALRKKPCDILDGRFLEHREPPRLLSSRSVLRINPLSPPSPRATRDVRFPLASRVEINSRVSQLCVTIVNFRRIDRDLIGPRSSIIARAFSPYENYNEMAGRHLLGGGVHSRRGGGERGGGRGGKESPPRFHDPSSVLRVNRRR